jgi:transcriptional regulator with XRE-family HTH domain
MANEFGARLRELRQNKGLTLRGLAQVTGVDFTYLSKIETGRPGYFPGAGTIRELAQALDVDAIDLLKLADKLPPELHSIAGSAKARRFFQRAQEVASPKDWDALLDFLEQRQLKSTKSESGGR